jgi:hypothetical protein
MMLGQRQKDVVRIWFSFDVSDTEMEVTDCTTKFEALTSFHAK